MDWPCSQQAWGNPQSLLDLQSHLVAQNSDDLEGVSDTLADLYDNIQDYTGCSLIVPSQTVPLSNPQPHSSPEPHTGLIQYCHAGYTASSSFRQFPGVGLPLSAVAAEYQFPANEQNFQQNFLPRPHPASTAELNSSLIPYGDAIYDSFPGFENALTADAALATQRIGEPYSYTRPIGRCVGCWAHRKPVSLFI